MSKSVGPFVAARVRITLDCPECACPVPVNGIVDEVMCGACQTVSTLTGGVGWDRILHYGKGEACLEHNVLMRSTPVAALSYFLAFGPKGGELHRKSRGVLLEIDTQLPSCLACKLPLDVDALGREATNEGAAVDAFCPGCGGKVAIRAPTAADLPRVHPACVAIVNETAARGSLREPEGGEKVMFSCLDCGAPSNVDGTTPRIMKCRFCEAASYLPDALWMRLHPTQRKRAFHVLLRADAEVIAQARREKEG